jgi:DNA gyrase subunit A
MYDVPEAKRATKGKALVNFLSLGSDENITSVIAMPKAVKGAGLSLLMVTKNGISKKVAAKSFEDVRRSGLIAISLDDNDELIRASFVQKGDTVSLVSAKGQAIRFKENDVREMGRTAGGVRAMKLGKGDMIVGVDVVPQDRKDAELMVLSENGYGKKSDISEYKIQKRGGSGIKTASVTAKTGKIMASHVIQPDEEELVVISKKGQVIRTELSGIPTLSRATQGVRIMKLRDGDSIASFICL